MWHWKWACRQVKAGEVGGVSSEQWAVGSEQCSRLAQPEDMGQWLGASASERTLIARLGPASITRLGLALPIGGLGRAPRGTSSKQTAVLVPTARGHSARKSQRRVSGMLPIAGQDSEESPLLSCQCSSHRTILSPALHHDTDTCSRSGNALRHPARAVVHPYTPGNASQQCLRVPIERREGGRPYLALWRPDTARTRMSITPNHVPTSRYV